MAHGHSAWAIAVAAILLAVAACDLKRSRPVFVSDVDGVVQDADEQSAGTESGPTAGQDTESRDNSIPRASTELLELATASTVHLALKNADASGVILGSDAERFVYVLTVWHAAREGIDQVAFFNSDSFPKPSARFARPEVVSHNERLDLAVIRVQADEELQFASMPLVKQGNDDGPDPKFAYSSGCDEHGFPTVLTETITEKGKFRVPNRPATGVDRGAEKGAARLMWVTDSPQQQGRSGGALIDFNGHLIGLALGKNGSFGYYCHFQEICDYLIDSGLAWLVRCDTTGERDN